MGHIESAIAEAMISAAESQDARSPCSERSGFEGGFDGFKSGVAEDGFARCLAPGPPLEGDPAEFAGEVAFQPVGMDITHGVEQAAHLPLAGANDARIGMASSGDAKCGCEVQIPFPIEIPNVNPIGALPNDRPGAFRVDECDVARFVLFEATQGRRGLWSGCRAQPSPAEISHNDSIPT